MTYCILLFRAHLSAGNLVTLRAKNWVIPKTVFTYRNSQNPSIEVGLFAMASSIWQIERSNTCEVGATFLIWNIAQLVKHLRGICFIIAV
jgi:hypothetical protein